jgi:hypothetical protein
MTIFVEVSNDGFNFKSQLDLGFFSPTFVDNLHISELFNIQDFLYYLLYKLMIFSKSWLILLNEKI